MGGLSPPIHPPQQLAEARRLIHAIGEPAYGRC